MRIGVVASVRDGNFIEDIQSSLAGLFFETFRYPGNELPGYYHDVPLGRQFKNVCDMSGRISQ